MLEVVTVISKAGDYAPYLPLLRAQRDSCLRVGHKHTVVTDADLQGFDTLSTTLGDDLMRAMILGVLRRLERPVEDHIVFVDADVLVMRDLNPVFEHCLPFDLGLTYRTNEVSPINNGVMYMHRDGAEPAADFFRVAHSICQPHWGGDQEAISLAASPVLHERVNKRRSGAMIRFMSMKGYNSVPKQKLADHGQSTFCVHFKGTTKEWMVEHAARYLGV